MMENISNFIPLFILLGFVGIVIWAAMDPGNRRTSDTEEDDYFGL